MKLFPVKMSEQAQLQKSLTSKGNSALLYCYPRMLTDDRRYSEI